MAQLAVHIPQIGEGLQEARLVAVLKQPGERVKRDEPIYQMETDKAVMDVESPYEGVLVEWLAAPDDVLPIGAEVARMDVAAGVEAQISPEPTATPQVPVEHARPAAQRNLSIPPRTRAYAKEKGVSDQDLEALAASSQKLMPADIDAFLASHAKPSATAAYEDRPVPGKQRVLNSRLVRGSQLVVPGTITVVVDWSPIDHVRAEGKASHSDFQPSAFTMFAFAVARAVKDHPAFRTSIIGEDTFRTYKHLSLGIAVGLPGDELVLAVVEEADAITWKEFASRTRERIETARTGKDQANEAVTLSLTNMQNFGLRNAVPVVVPPAVATLFIGEIYRALPAEGHSVETYRACNLTLTFDHRVMNGVGAAQFMNEVKKNVEAIHRLTMDEN